MLRVGLLCGSLVLSLAVPAHGQAPGGLPGSFGSQGTRKSGDDLMPSSSSPSIAPTLDIRIQGEGLSLPRGVSEDDPPAKPPAERPKPPAGAAKSESTAK